LANPCGTWTEDFFLENCPAGFNLRDTVPGREGWIIFSQLGQASKKSEFFAENKNENQPLFTAVLCRLFRKWIFGFHLRRINFSDVGKELAFRPGVKRESDEVVAV
jgi:hypothetical protein